MIMSCKLTGCSFSAVVYFNRLNLIEKEKCHVGKSTIFFHDPSDGQSAGVWHLIQMLANCLLVSWEIHTRQFFSRKRFKKFKYPQKEHNLYIKFTIQLLIKNRNAIHVYPCSWNTIVGICWTYYNLKVTADTRDFFVEFF